MFELFFGFIFIFAISFCFLVSASSTPPHLLPLLLCSSFCLPLCSRNQSLKSWRKRQALLFNLVALFALCCRPESHGAQTRPPPFWKMAPFNCPGPPNELHTWRMGKATVGKEQLVKNIGNRRLNNMRFIVKDNQIILENQAGTCVRFVFALQRCHFKIEIQIEIQRCDYVLL